MKIRTKRGYERAMRELARLEASEPDAACEARRQELEAAIAAYAPKRGQPATSKAKPRVHDADEESR